MKCDQCKRSHSSVERRLVAMQTPGEPAFVKEALCQTCWAKIEPVMTRAFAELKAAVSRSS